MTTSFRAAAAVLLMAFAVCDAGRAEEERVMTLADLAVVDAPPAPVVTSVPTVTVGEIIDPEPVIIETTPAPVAVQVDPLIYNEDGSLYTGPMPDGAYSVNGRITTTPIAGRIPDAAIVDSYPYDADAGSGTVIIERPGYFYWGIIDPDYERYWGDHVWLPGYNRWDLYRYRPDRRPPHHPERYRGDRSRRPDRDRVRPRPEGPRGRRPDRIGRLAAPRGGRDGGNRPNRPDRPRRPRR